MMMMMMMINALHVKLLREVEYMKAKIFCLSLALENHHQALDACTRFATATARKISCSEPSRRVKGLFVQMLERKRRTGGRTRPITLPFPLTRSAEKITDKGRLRYNS